MMHKIPQPSESEQIKPEALVKVIKKEPKDQALEQKIWHPHKKPLPKGIIWGIAGLAAFFVVGTFVSYYIVRARVTSSLSANIGTLRAGVEDLQNFDPQAAQEKFSTLQGLSSGDFGSVVQALGFLFKGGAGAVVSLSDFGNQLTQFTAEVGDAASSSYQFMSTGNGTALIADLTRMRDTLAAIDAESSDLTNAASFLGGWSSLGGGDFYLSLKTQVEGAKSALDAFLPWLAEPQPHHLLVLLQNPSEMRATGGFLGSYADITIASGSITNIDVRDIADVDAAFAQKIIPPKPLQLEVSRWRPADANWFFDFPTSASKTIAFFEASGLYAKSSTTFDGAIAISPDVIGNLLSMTGPITVGKPATTFSADNFLVKIQNIVQNGQATSATYPKAVIGDLADAIFTKLASSTQDTRAPLFTAMMDWIANKDVMIYFKDPGMESVVSAYGADGAVYTLPQKFNGDYLAVVDTNVNGQKSDLYVSSTVDYTAQINADGTLSGHLTVIRRHNGNKSPYWWYRATNQDYVQIFTPPGTTLANASGTVLKKITAPINYAKNGYVSDPTVMAIESTEQTLFAYPGVAWHAESGKQVFETWSTVKAGATTQFSLDYTRKLFLPPAPGVQYQFVFDKQAGTHRSYVYTIEAPLGYVFAETGLATYTYTAAPADDPPGELIISLTLQSL